MAGIAGYRNAPAEAGPGNRQVLQPAAHKADDLVAAAARSDCLWMCVVPSQQAVLPSGQPEKIVFLLEPFDLGSGRCKFRPVWTRDQLAFVVEGLVAHRVPSGKPSEIDLAAAFKFAP